MTEAPERLTQRGFGIHRLCVFLNAALPYKEDRLQSYIITHKYCGQPVNMIMYQVCSVGSASAVQYAAPLVCMEARKKARLIPTVRRSFCHVLL